jgi:hypothetical protein
MDTIRTFVAEHRILLIFAAAAFILSLVIKLVLARVTKNIIERFQNTTSVPKITRENLPPEIASPDTQPTIQQTDCDILKKAIDAMRLTEQTKKSEELAKSQLFKNMKSEMEEKFRTLDCATYLKRVEAGELSAPQTAPDMRPDPLPPFQM